MAAATPGIAVCAKLKATTAVNTAVAGRVFPQLDTQEPGFPQIVYTVLGADAGKTLNRGGSRLKRYTVRIDCYAETELEAGALAKLVKDALAPETGAAWSDSASGVQGAFHEDTVTEFTEDGIRVQGETFGVWHEPT